MNNLRANLEAKRCQTSVETPVIDNPPGRSAVAYRIGTQPSFSAAMRRRLPEVTIPDGVNQGTRPLADLDQEVDDPAVALVDTWAVAADVLTFYQERIAGENYLRTATERRSVVEMARLVGHELGPGVAAGAFLTFDVETAPGSPESAVVPVGTRVNSIPGQNELPQTFETRERIVARGAWNQLVPRLAEAQLLAGSDVLYLAGVGTNLVAGDLLLLVDTAEDDRTAVVRLLDLTTDSDLDLTLVRLQPPLPDDFGADPAAVEAFAFRDKAACFGHNAPRFATLPKGEFFQSEEFPYTDWDEGRTIWTDSAQVPYSDGSDPESPALFVERRIDALVPGSTVIVTGTTLAGDGTPAVATTEVFRVTAVSEASLVDYSLSSDVAGVGLAGVGGAVVGATPFDLRKTTVYLVSEALADAELPLPEMPITDPYPSDARLAEDTGGSSLVLDRQVTGLRPGQAVALTGRLQSGDELRQTVLLRAVDDDRVAGRTTLVFQQAVKLPAVAGGGVDRLDRSTLILNANVAQATHGESVEEVLGSGDASQASQSFRLQRSPLTFDSAPIPGGARSSLAVRVDGVLWQEVANLHGQGPDAQVYTVGVDADGGATVRFGDGIDGARLPSGSENVSAVYRFGIGPDGEVGADSLSLLATRPLGIATVANPLAAAGAAAPDTVAEARRDAPVTVRTLGRIVSLADFEDFTVAFAGIGKVRAVPLGGVHLTIAGVGGRAIDPGSVLFENLFEAIETARLPGPPLHLASYEPLPFEVAAKLVIDPRFRAEEVFERVREALVTAYAFERREMAQSLYPSDVLDLVQSIAGVVAVDLDAVFLTGTTPALPARLDALAARRRGADTLPAQLLLINPDGITLGVRTP